MSSATVPCPLELNDFTWACWIVFVGSCSVQNVTGPVVAAVPLEPDDPQASTVTASPATASSVPRACLLVIASFIAHLSTGPGARPRRPPATLAKRLWPGSGDAIWGDSFQTRPQVP